MTNTVVDTITNPCLMTGSIIAISLDSTRAVAPMRGRLHDLVSIAGNGPVPTDRETSGAWYGKAELLTEELALLGFELSRRERSAVPQVGEPLDVRQRGRTRCR